MTCCALYLAQGSTMLYQSEKAGTIKLCLEAASDVVINLKKLVTLKKNFGIKAQHIDSDLAEVK